jgi:hypothetical protein
MRADGDLGDDGLEVTRTTTTLTETVDRLTRALAGAASSHIARSDSSATTSGDAMRLRQALLATASETAFTDVPFHRPDHRPTYDHGDRDAAEGFGRIDPGAAVDAVSRTLVDGRGLAQGEMASTEEFPSVGLTPVDDARAVAGHVVAPDGTIDAEVAFARYAGSDVDTVTGVPWLDLFVYDAEAPRSNGAPNIVASAQGTAGYGHTGVDVTAADSDVYYVVAKLVNVPGAVGTQDVQARCRLSVSFTAAQHPALTATGTRAVDGHAFRPGETARIQVSVSDISEQVPDDDVVEVYDYAPWALADVGTDDARSRRASGRVSLVPTTAAAIRDGGVTRTYVVEAPSEPGEYQFGAASVELPATVADLRTDTATVGGTDAAYVVDDAQRDPGERVPTDASPSDPSP